MLAPFLTAVLAAALQAAPIAVGAAAPPLEAVTPDGAAIGGGWSSGDGTVVARTGQENFLAHDLALDSPKKRIAAGCSTTLARRRCLIGEIDAILEPRGSWNCPGVRANGQLSEQTVKPGRCVPLRVGHFGAD